MPNLPRARARTAQSAPSVPGVRRGPFKLIRAAGQDESHVSGEFAHAERLIKRRPILAGDVQSGDVFILFGCAALALGMLAWPFNESPRCIRSLESVVPLL